MIRVLCFLLAIISALLQCTHKEYSITSENQRIQVIEGDTSKTFFITKEVKRNETYLKDTRIYWYRQNRIFITVGGFNGPLLHGEYTAMVSGNYLLEKGNFDEGLKDGEWRRWHPNGEINSVYNWAEGKREGEFHIYNAEGVLIQKGKYRKDKLNGIVIIYDNNGKAINNKYKNGVKKQPVEKEKEE